MTDRRFVNPKGGYFVEDARGRLRDAPRHNPDNLHIGESWYGGPLARQGNPRVDGDNTFNAGWKKGWGEIKDNWDSGRKGLEDWRREQEGPNIMNPLKDQASYSPSERVYPKFMIDSLLQQGSIMQSEIKQIAPDSFQVTPRGMDPKPLRPTEYYTMNRGLDNYGRGNKTYDGTFRQEGFGDPNARDPWGQDEYYDNDDYDIDILDPGFGGYGSGPLHFG